MLKACPLGTQRALFPGHFLPAERVAKQAPVDREPLGKEMQVLVMEVELVWTAAVRGLGRICYLTEKEQHLRIQSSFYCPCINLL